MLNLLPVLAALLGGAGEGVQLLRTLLPKRKQRRSHDLLLGDGAGASQQTNGCAMSQCCIYELCYACSGTACAVDTLQACAACDNLGSCKYCLSAGDSLCLCDMRCKAVSQQQDRTE